MGRPIMAPIAATGLSYDERIAIRKAALEYAAKYAAAQNLDSGSVVTIAKRFEEYLKEGV